MIKAVLFDLDGTLIDSSEGIIKSILHTLEHFGIVETDMEKLHKFIGPPLAGSFRKYYDFSEEQAYEAVQVYRGRYNKTGIYECSLYPGVEECIKTLKEEGYRIGMASSKPEDACKRILEHFGILELFDNVAGAAVDGTRDTKEEVLNEVFRRWQDVPKEETCLIGDTIFDVEGARQVGVRCIAVTYGFGDLEEMKEAGIAGICDDMRELPELIRKG
ncbi:MAG: HAD hydrolase-like protein [Lachnospiraceae bacterium]|nr:HAD hydrolase-like protein [Lachnospiraceae bacterium]